jgi:hypothetical protein
MWIANTLTHISNNIGAPHTNVGISDFIPINVEYFGWLYVRSCTGLKMNFQKLIGLVRKSQDDRLFGDIVGYEHIKRLFHKALESESMTHILLVGPPASAKKNVTT